MSMIALAGLAAPALADTSSMAGEPSACCSPCACGQCCKKVCRLKCEMKPVTTFVYECKCEDFCIPGPSKKCGTRQVADCNARGGCRTEIVWQPTCGQVRTRKVLVKVPVTKQVRVYTWEVVNVCCGCGSAQVDEAATAAARAEEIVPASAEEPIASEAPGEGTVRETADATFLSRIFAR